MTQQAVVHAPMDSGVPEEARDFSVRDRVVIITGAGQGIGREFARQFAAAGAVAVVADRDEGKGAEVVAEIVRAGGRAMTIKVDIADERSVEAMASEVARVHGRTDVLVNNAGIFATLGRKPFDQISPGEWDQVMQVNVTGTFLCVRSVSAHMRKARWGRIVNIASDAVVLGVANYLHYVASRSAVIGMTNALARELGPHGITVNAVRPGGVATEVERTVNPSIERRTAMMAQQCLPRGQLPTDLVGLVMFLSTPASDFVTGQTIACDGGLTHC